MLDVSTFPRGDVGPGVRDDRPAVTAGVGVGTMGDRELGPVIERARGVGRRPGHCGGAG